MSGKGYTAKKGFRKALKTEQNLRVEEGPTKEGSQESKFQKDMAFSKGVDSGCFS